MIQSELCFGCMETKGSVQKCQYCGYVEGTERESLLHLPPGTILHDKYLIGKALGQGGFGITYIAWDTNLNLKLAIKEYLPQHLATRTVGDQVTIYKSSLDDQFKYGLSSFLEEARILARFFDHPNIVSVRDYFEANGTAYLVMNYYEGLSLQAYLTTKGEALDLDQALIIFMPVLDALKTVHAAGILHRDISPDNLIINIKGQVILIDFGAARQAMQDKSHSLSVIMKPGYSPEEQYRRKGEQGPWSDIYALAATIYRTITGQMPPESLDRLAEDTLTPPSVLGINIDSNLEQAILKALAVRARDRYQTADEFLEALLVDKIYSVQSIQEAEASGEPGDTAEALAIQAEAVPEKAEAMAKMIVEEVTIDDDVAEITMKAEDALPDDELSEALTAPESIAADESINIENMSLNSTRYLSYFRKHKLLLASTVFAILLIAFASILLLFSDSDQAHQADLDEQQDYSIDVGEDVILAEDAIPDFKPSVPVLVGPEDGFIESESETTIEWQPVEGADKYMILLTTSSDGKSIEKELGNINYYKIDDLPGDGSEYVVQIAAGNNVGWSVFSEPRKIISGTVAQKTKPSEVSQTQPQEKPGLTAEDEMKLMREKLDAMDAALGNISGFGGGGSGGGGSGGGGSSGPGSDK